MQKLFTSIKKYISKRFFSSSANQANTPKKKQAEQDKQAG
jgi:hypothetical protein